MIGVEQGGLKDGQVRDAQADHGDRAIDGGILGGVAAEPDGGEEGGAGLPGTEPFGGGGRSGPGRPVYRERIGVLGTSRARAGELAGRQGLFGTQFLRW